MTQPKIVCVHNGTHACTGPVGTVLLHNASKLLALTCTCKQIRSECGGLFYIHNRFQLTLQFPLALTPYPGTRSS